MPSPSPIRLDAVSKCYRIYEHPQDRFRQALRSRLPWRKEAAPLYREHWALREISFELQAGEAMGIVGRNGAGKSTLLQIIAGTLEPTAGYCETRGRTTALLELGSGFNPEFSGRENVFLNAMILGLSRKAIEDRFDDIAGFADIGDFIDQPVKMYSSGMMMRLAFAVQTAVDPSVLIVDEALSVGDMFFQAKCMARINKLVSDGVALLFVSHDASTIRQLCHRAALLDHGRLVGLGPSKAVVDQYIQQQLEDRNRHATQPKPAPAPISSDLKMDEDARFGQAAFQKMASSSRAGNGQARFVNVQMRRRSTHAVEFDFNDEIEIRCFAQFHQALDNCNISLKVRTLQGTDVLYFDTRLQDSMTASYRAGVVYCFQWTFRLPLLHGAYALSCGIAHPPVEAGSDWVFVDVVPHAYDFRVSPRRKGMLDGYTTLPAQLVIHPL